MNIVAIIQARMGSTRLPGKVLLPLKGKPVLWHIVNRLKACKNINNIVIATSVEENDNKIECFCKENKIDYFRGSEKNVLERYYFTARKFQADHIVRITADNPVLDPKIIDELIDIYKKDQYDFYGVGSGFPYGISGAIFSFKALEESYLNAKVPSEKEHVGLYIKKRSKEYKVGFYGKYKDLGDYRWTLDTKEDYLLIKKIYDALYKKEELFFTEDILKFIEKNPQFKTINKNTIRDAGLLKTLMDDENYLNKKI
ncbi:cytidylyltransferase domain-containing protein [Crassaminicella profunda]|uniref:cytidylyltransferase domain-containing protein n=1 Tax=Crassaminicella profunda TaxID=1286698 RepID=UPI001CA6481B|nr:glycosyltransferase family protein [Crassaminicella profunda]QZY56318.1 glycosyltransferase family protein [Crassaminicella profunda]